MSDAHAIKKGDWVVLHSGKIEQAEKDYLPQWVDSVWTSKEVAEIRSGIVKHDQRTTLLTPQAVADQALMVWEAELSKSRKELLEELNK